MIVDWEIHNVKSNEPKLYLGMMIWEISQCSITPSSTNTWELSFFDQSKFDMNGQGKIRPYIFCLLEFTDQIIL